MRPEQHLHRKVPIVRRKIESSRVSFLNMAIGFWGSALFGV
jgi:hypothetical protein